MTEQEQIAYLTNENTRLRGELQQALALIAQQAEEIAELTARVGRDSQNSSKPPASDGLSQTASPSTAREGTEAERRANRASGPCLATSRRAR